VSGQANNLLAKHVVVLAFDDIPVNPSAHMPSIVVHTVCPPNSMSCSGKEGPLQSQLATPTSAENGLLNNEVTLPRDHFNFHSAANGPSGRLNSLLFHCGGEMMRRSSEIH
jgi:hypothetical protein